MTGFCDFSCLIVPGLLSVNTAFFRRVIQSGHLPNAESAIKAPLSVRLFVRPRSAGFACHLPVRDSSMRVALRIAAGSREDWQVRGTGGKFLR